MLHPCSPFVPLASLLTSQVLNTLVSRLLPIFFHVKTYSLFALYLKNRVDFFLETERKKISIFFFPFSFLPSRRELSSTRTQTQYVISRKLKNETVRCIQRERVSWSRTLPRIEFTTPPMLYYPDESTSL